jgi:hypothetical protein
MSVQLNETNKIQLILDSTTIGKTRKITSASAQLVEILTRRLIFQLHMLCLKSKSVHKRSDHCLAISTLTTGYMILNVLRVLCWKTSLNDYFWSKIALYLVIWSWKIRRRVRISTSDFKCEWFLKFNEKTLVGVVSTFYYSRGIAHRYFYLLNITQPYQIHVQAGIFRGRLRNRDVHFCLPLNCIKYWLVSISSFYI